MPFDATDHSEANHDEDYWYKNRYELEQGQVFKLYDGSIVKLDDRVLGDGTKWNVADWQNGWVYCKSTIEPGDLRGLPIQDTPEAISAVVQSKVRLHP